MIACAFALGIGDLLKGIENIFGSVASGRSFRCVGLIELTYRSSMSGPMIILFCGIPGSGKSTIAELLAKRLAVLGRVETFSSDKLRGPIYKKFFKILAERQQGAHFIIFDATFYKKEWREQITALAQDSIVVTVYLDCPLEIALGRNKIRQPNISEKAVHIMFHQMEPPERPDIVIDSATTTAADAAERIFELVKERSGSAVSASSPEDSSR